MSKLSLAERVCLVLNRIVKTQRRSIQDNDPLLSMEELLQTIHLCSLLVAGQATNPNGPSFRALLRNFEKLETSFQETETKITPGNQL